MTVRLKNVLRYTDRKDSKSLPFTQIAINFGSDFSDVQKHSSRLKLSIRVSLNVLILKNRFSQLDSGPPTAFCVGVFRKRGKLQTQEILESFCSIWWLSLRRKCLWYFPRLPLKSPAVFVTARWQHLQLAATQRLSILKENLCNRKRVPNPIEQRVFTRMDVQFSTLLSSPLWDRWKRFPSFRIRQSGNWAVSFDFEWLLLYTRSLKKEKPLFHVDGHILPCEFSRAVQRKTRSTAFGSYTAWIVSSWHTIKLLQSYQSLQNRVTLMEHQEGSFPTIFKWAAKTMRSEHLF